MMRKSTRPCAAITKSAKRRSAASSAMSPGKPPSQGCLSMTQTRAPLLRNSPADALADALRAAGDHGHLVCKHAFCLRFPRGSSPFRVLLFYSPSPAAFPCLREKNGLMAARKMCYAVLHPMCMALHENGRSPYAPFFICSQEHPLVRLLSGGRSAMAGRGEERSSPGGGLRAGEQPYRALLLCLLEDSGRDAWLEYAYERWAEVEDALFLRMLDILARENDRGAKHALRGKGRRFSARAPDGGATATRTRAEIGGLTENDRQTPRPDANNAGARRAVLALGGRYGVKAFVLLLFVRPRPPGSKPPILKHSRDFLCGLPHSSLEPKPRSSHRSYRQYKLLYRPLLSSASGCGPQSSIITSFKRQMRFR